MKRKKHFRVLLVCLLAVAMMAGILVATVSASPVTVEFVNPLGQVIPTTNQPLGARLPSDLAGKTIRVLYYGTGNNTSQVVMTSLQGALNAAGATALAPAAISGTSFDARTPAQYDTWANGADAVVIGIVEDNVAAWWMGYHAREIEARGAAVVVITTEWLEAGVRTGAQDNGFAALRIVTIPKSPLADAQSYATGLPTSARRTYIDNNIVGGTINTAGAVITALTAPATAAEQSAAPLTVAQMGIPYADGRKTLAVTGNDEVQAMSAFFDLSMAQGFGDGLPLVVPTREAVDDMIAVTGRKADEVLGRVMTRGGILTVEQVAANAVMAGARPIHFPTILAVMEAYGNGWEENKLFYRALMASESRTLAMVVSGPIVGSAADKLDLGRTRQHGLGSDDSVVIGRAVMLSIRNAGHIAYETAQIPGSESRICPHELYVIAEASEYLPTGWVTLSEHMGFGTGSNTVTLLDITQARWTGGVGGTAAGGAVGTYDNMASIRTQGTSANLNNCPGIFAITYRDAHYAASMNTGSRLAGGYSTVARGIGTKEMMQRFIAGTGGNQTENSTNPVTITRVAQREALIWPIVAGHGNSTQGRVFHAASADYNDSRGFHTQLIGGATAPSAPQNFTVNVATAGEAVLTWAAPERGTVVKYQVSSNNGRTWVDAGTATTHTFTGLGAGQYFFAVRATNDIKNSADVRATGTLSATNPAFLDFRSSGRGAWAWKVDVVQ